MMNLIETDLFRSHTKPVIRKSVWKQCALLRRSKSVPDLCLLLEYHRLRSKLEGLGFKDAFKLTARQSEPTARCRTRNDDYKFKCYFLLERQILLQQALKNKTDALTIALSWREDYNDVKKIIEKMKDKNSLLHMRNKILECENGTLKQLVKELELKLRNEEEQSRLHETHASALKKQLSKREKMIESLKEAMGELNTATNILIEKNQINEEKQRLMEKSYNEMRAANNFALQRVSKLETELRNSLTMIEALNETVEEYRGGLKECFDLRRTLHNNIQDLKGNIRVFCRVRPGGRSDVCKPYYHINFKDETTIEVMKKDITDLSGNKKGDAKLEFVFDKVFPPESSQEEVFQELSPLIQSALDGFHVCVFAYGQTNSGKTFTMIGGKTDKLSGMIPRSVDLVFEYIGKLEKIGWKYQVLVSFLEIYNENIKDLLNPSGKGPYEIRFNEGRGTTVTNLTVKMISSAQELQGLMLVSQENRAMASTNFNAQSSRSHVITKICLTGSHETHNLVYSGSLNLVDLAGSESAKTAINERLTETKNINKSLSTLGNVMLALCNKDSHIPYRNSKLTYLLQPCLGGNSKTLMFANISPFEECYSESINSLRFASKVKQVKIECKRDKSYLKTTG